MIANQFGKPVDTSNITTSYFKEMLVDAGIDPSVKFHDLRHTHATLLLLGGIRSKVVQERLGHSTVTMALDTCSPVLPDMLHTSWIVRFQLKKAIQYCVKMVILTLADKWESILVDAF